MDQLQGAPDFSIIVVQTSSPNFQISRILFVLGLLIVFNPFSLMISLCARLLNRLSVIEFSIVSLYARLLNRFWCARFSRFFLIANWYSSILIIDLVFLLPPSPDKNESIFQKALTRVDLIFLLCAKYKARVLIFVHWHVISFWDLHRLCT